MILFKYTFLVILWNEDGNTIIDKRYISINRRHFNTAKEYLIKRYPNYFIELDKSKLIKS